MNQVTNKWSISIIITNQCKLNCLYCTQYVRHLNDLQKYNMSLYEFESALISIKGWWKNKINIFGGEPTEHPQFDEICKIARYYFPRKKLQLFTYAGKDFEKYKRLIRKTFINVFKNEHPKNKEVCRHQPLTVAINEAIPNEELRNYLIENCWVDRKWCCAINHHGFYFCEIASAIDHILFGGRNAIGIYPEWWKYESWEHQYKLCQFCGMAIPMQRDKLSQVKEKMTPKLRKKLQTLNMVRLDDKWIIPFDEQFTTAEIKKNALSWYPGNFREDKHIDKDCQEGLGIKFKL